MLVEKGNKRVIMTKNNHFSRFKKASTTLNKLYFPLKIERRKRDLMLGKIKLELLKNAKEGLQKEIEILIETELKGLKGKIIGQEVIKKIVFIFENEVTEVKKRGEKIVSLVFTKAIDMNTKNINMLIDVDYKEGVNIDNIYKNIIGLLEEEIIEGKWYMIMAQKILNDINKIKVTWEKLIKKIEIKSDKRNVMSIIREDRMENIREREKSFLKEVEKRVFNRLVEVSHNIIINNTRIIEETTKDRYRSNLVIDIKEILVLKKVEINVVIAKLNEKGKKQRDQVGGEYVERITNNVCKIIKEKIIKYNWYYGLCRKWCKITSRITNKIKRKREKSIKERKRNKNMNEGSGKDIEDKKDKEKKDENGEDLENSGRKKGKIEIKRKRSMTTSEDIRKKFRTEDNH
jgi:hypothetical protein